MGHVFLLLGIVLLAGLIGEVVGARAHVPRVTVLLLVGVIVGPSLLDVMPADGAVVFPVVAQLVLVLVGLLLGGEFTRRRLAAGRVGSPHTCPPADPRPRV